MDAKRYLEKIAMMKARIKNKEYEIEMLRQEAINPATSTIHSECVSISQTTDRLQKQVADYVVMEEHIHSDILKMLKYQQEVIGNIEKLKVTEYDVLHKRYVQDLSLYDIATLYDKSYSWVTTVCGKAIKNLQKILDEEGI